MKDFFVPKDLLLFSNSMGMNSDFSVRGFSGGQGEAMETLTVTVSNVVLYIPMTGDNGSIVFTDIKGHTITRYSPAVINTGDGPQDIESFCLCDISSTGAAYKALSVVGSEALNVAGQDFCVDFFVKFNAAPNPTHFSPGFFAKRGASSNIELSIQYWQGKIYVVASITGSVFVNPIPATLWVPTVGVWHYIRLNRSGNTWRLYIDTNKVAQAEWANTVYSGTAQITLLGDGANTMVSNISMSHFRMTIGSSRETTDTIVIPTLPYPLT